MNRLFNYLVNIKSEGNSKRIFFLAVFSAIIISAAHYFTYSSESVYFEFLHELLTKLYFIPVLVSALLLGFKEAMKLSFVVTLFYLPHGINTKLFSGLTFIEHLTEIILIWTVGTVSGLLTDKLKKIHIEKTRLAELKKVSAVINVVNRDMMSDYSACVGLIKSFSSFHNKDDGNFFTVKLLSERFERLGAHINHLSNLAAPEPLKKTKYNFFHLVKKCVSEILQNNPSNNVSFTNGNNLPPVYMDVRQVEFALKQILQSFIEREQDEKNIFISTNQIKNKIAVLITLNGSKRYIKSKQSEFFDLVSDSESGYSLALALSIIKSHGGNMEFDLSENRGRSIRFYMPL